MKTVKWVLETGIAGCQQENEFEVEDDTSNVDIEIMVLEDVWSYIGVHWEVTGEGDIK